MAGRIIAKTGNEAGVTKAQQRIKLDNNVILTDTPGFFMAQTKPGQLWLPAGRAGAIKDTAFDYADIAMYAADYLLKHYPQQVMARYQLAEQPDNDLALLDAIGQRRGCMVKGGIVDLTKAGTILITELRAGLFGPVSLETPEMVTQELADAKLEQARLEKEKAEREKERARKAKKEIPLAGIYLRLRAACYCYHQEPAIGVEYVVIPPGQLSATRSRHQYVRRRCPRRTQSNPGLWF